MRDEKIAYPHEEPPEPGGVMQVAPGVHWLRMPIPFALDHINLWILEDDAGCTLVDTGIASSTTRGIWEDVLAGPLGDRPVQRVVVTHLHPDHAGCAGWLTERFGVELWMTREEYFLCRLLVADTGREAPRDGVKFYASAGFGEDAVERYQKMFGAFGKMVSPLPDSYRRLKDGMSLRIGAQEWQVLVGKGHSPEHACLYCPALNVVISGDQILPTISSNVSVYPTEPGADPLGDWLDSIRYLRSALPADVLVLPAHGKPFHGAHARLDTLAAEHEAGLQDLEQLCAAEPRRVVDTFKTLFKREISGGNLIMATGESIAHLNYLAQRDRLTIDTDADGVSWYSAGG